jgi:hypothetical protein
MLLAKFNGDGKKRLIVLHWTNSEHGYNFAGWFGLKYQDSAHQPQFARFNCVLPIKMVEQIVIAAKMQGVIK